VGVSVFGFSHVIFVEVERESLPEVPFEFRWGEGAGSKTVLVESL
jgi:hypothetical protein